MGFNVGLVFGYRRMIFRKKIDINNFFDMLWFLEKIKVYKPNDYQDSFRPLKNGKGFVQVVNGTIIQTFKIKDIKIIFEE
jgi:hypothetical protein